MAKDLEDAYRYIEMGIYTLYLYIGEMYMHIENARVIVVAHVFRLAQMAMNFGASHLLHIICRPTTIRVAIDFRCASPYTKVL